MPATVWTEIVGALPGWQDRLPSILPPTQIQTQTAYVLMDVLIPNTTYIAILPGDETWTEQSVAATSHAELTVSATAWTELT